MRKKIVFMSISILLSLVTLLNISAIDDNNENHSMSSVDCHKSKNYTEVEIAKEIADQTSQLQTLENSKINANVRSLNYTVKLEPVTIQNKSTGFREASNQPVNGINCGPYGGSFGYKNGNTSRPVSLSFGISGFSTSFSVGVGSKQESGVNGYRINAQPNRSVKLYVNKQVKVTTYKRYKVYTINGYKELYGYVIGTPIVTRLDFDVR